MADYLSEIALVRILPTSFNLFASDSRVRHNVS